MNKNEKWHVIETPCYPAAFKANPPLRCRGDNAAYLYKRTEKEAQELCNLYNGD